MAGLDFALGYRRAGRSSTSSHLRLSDGTGSNRSIRHGKLAFTVAALRGSSAAPEPGNDGRIADGGGLFEKHATVVPNEQRDESFMISDGHATPVHHGVVVHSLGDPGRPLPQRDFPTSTARRCASRANRQLRLCESKREQWRPVAGTGGEVIR